MASYLLKRLLHMIPLFFGITIISFWVIHLAPGRPTGTSEDLNPKISLEVRQRLEKLYDLDKPLVVQYGLWLKKLARCDFGVSFSDGRPVLKKFWETIPVTFAINLISILLILGLGIPIGAIGALKENTTTDKMISAGLFAAFVMPTFWLALLLMDIFGVKLGWLPVSGLTSPDHEYYNYFEKVIDLSKHLLLPVLVSCLGGLAGMARYMRQNMLQVLNSKYILAARARGLPEHTILYKHALKNAVLPVITLLGLSLPGLIGGSVIFESIFAIPGTGRLFFMAVMSRDYPVIMALLVISALLTVFGSLLADICYGLADPRIRLKKNDERTD